MPVLHVDDSFQGLPLVVTTAKSAYRGARRVLRIAGGATCIAGGLLMVVLPGPAIVFIPLGLLLIASESPWLRDRIVRALARAEAAAGRLKSPRGAKLRDWLARVGARVARL